MIDVNIKFGINAGRIWRALDSNKSLTKVQLINKTNIKENEIFQAIGWLAKENKIKKDGEFYFLDNTNLSEKIKQNAKIILSLFENGKININNLKNITKMDEENLNLALGWLAKDGKLGDNIFNDSLEGNSNKIKIDDLRNEIDILNADLKERNLIITQLTNQLNINQFNLIENTEKHNMLKDEIDQKNNEILKKKNELKIKNLKINDLKVELDNSNSNILTRNLIIKHISNQLTDKETQCIENSNLITNLKSEINQNKNLIKIANEKINDRIKALSSLQDKSYKSIDKDFSKSTLFSKSDSFFNKKEKIENIDNNIKEIIEDNLICDSDKIENSTLKNRKNDNEDH
jgi:hypothetical protein